MDHKRYRLSCLHLDHLLRNLVCLGKTQYWRKKDATAMLGATETLSEEEQDELGRELTKVEGIQTLSSAKEKHLAETKQKLRMGSLQEVKQNIAKGCQDVKARTTYKTSEI